jgi:hypothetical protein
MGATPAAVHTACLAHMMNGDGVNRASTTVEDLFSLPVFRSGFRMPESGAAATVFLSEHCSSFCFVVQKIVQILIN